MRVLVCGDIRTGSAPVELPDGSAFFVGTVEARASATPARGDTDGR